MPQIALFTLTLSALWIGLRPVTAFSADLPLARQQRGSSIRSHYDTSLYTISGARAAEFEFTDDNSNGARGLSQEKGTWEASVEERSESRNRRLEREEEARSRFVTGDDLHVLRQQILALKESLNEARSVGATRSIRELERTILRAQAKDAEFVYKVALERMEKAQLEGHEEEVEQLKEEAMLARSALPQFNLEGLWVGKYGDQGYELINVTYVGNTLVAYKLTSKKNVPKGEVSFKVDLSPKMKQNRGTKLHESEGSAKDNMKDSGLEPIELGEKAAQQWGSKYLQRFSGQGQVSAEGFVNSQWVDGQLIIVKEYFSFAWLPISHQVFFGRPSAALTLKLLAESKSNRSKDGSIRHYFEKCLEETALLDDEMEVNDTPFSSHDQHDYYNKEGFFD